MAKPEKIQIPITFPQFDRMIDLLESIDKKLTRTIKDQGEIMASIEELQTEVTENTDLVGSVISLVNGLADQLEAAIAANDPAAIQAVADQMRSNNQALADAVAANTPAAPEG